MSVKPRGRPRRELDASLLEAASSEFLEYGYTDANIERIALAGNTTKPALYRRYPSKEALFEATLNYLAKEFELDLRCLDPARPVEDALFDLAKLLYEKMGTAKVVSMSRLGARTSLRFPALILAFREQIRSGFMGPVTAYFQGLNDRGVVRMPSIPDAAIIFATLTGRPHERMIGLELAPHKVEPYLRELVRFFLAGYVANAPRA
ncbi:TetR/AcrR family transcriptional regulator [Pseudomonas capeferrum]|uniref:TetR/AcrR family transcriptional regulator n=1 Tax=Pseudomonas capeferrum TaxID=1495066 RepID=UPI0015E454E0|nr:TetR/AcrR family transcriptional regulator [Pseudomonas capeferrum]MBA1204266.1 TetR/AcrR family transcriptional regulator [Pseudomonas capeferrum]